MRSFGTLIQEAPANPTPLLSRSVEDRFADIVAYTAQQMPRVVVGERYLVTNTDIEVLALARDGGQVAVYDPAVPSVTWLSQRTFADTFTHLGDAEPEVASRAGLATLLAAVFDTPLDEHAVTCAAALADLLGVEDAYEYLDGLMDFEFADGEACVWTLDTLLDDARLYQAEQIAIEAEDAAEEEIEADE